MKILKLILITFLFSVLYCWVLLHLYGDVLKEQWNPTPEYKRLSAEEHQEYRRLLRKHGLLWQIAIVEEDKDGSLWFWRDGQRCRLQ